MQKKLLRTFTLLLAAAFFAALAGCGDARPTAASADGAADMQSATQPMIALTFDDGPSIHTERLLDLFAKYGGHGTFCVIGNRIDLLPDTVARTVREGNELAVHSWDHCQLTRLGADKVTEEIETTRQKIFELTGGECTVLRPTYGAVNDTLMRVAKDLDSKTSLSASERLVLLSKRLTHEQKYAILI